ncbi:MAG: CHAD domain-containing protein [Noviherbaspirillum sp.]
MEIELKLLVDPADIDALRAHPLLQQYAAEKPHKQELISTYFDTPDQQVRQKEAALRVRQVDHGWVQTLKGGGRVEAGLHQRDEWEGRVDGPALDLGTLRDMVGAHTPWTKMLRDPALAQQLVPIFSTRITRTIWELVLPDGEEIECALDLGTLEHEDTRLPIHELELELKAGNPQRLFDFALQLLDTVPMRIGNASKAERGYTLYAPQPEAPVKAERVALSPSMTVEQGFQAIVAACIAHIQGNEAGVVHGDDPESVHQMRVGLRRLRSAFRLFRDALPVPDDLYAECGWLAAELGAARDWEVLAGSTLAVVGKSVPDDAGLDALRQAASGVARDKRAQAGVAIQSVRYTRLMLSLARWLQGAQWRAGMPESGIKRLDTPLQKFAGRMLVQDQRKLLKRGKRLRGADAPARHKLRIAAKKTRYATEYFQSLYPAKRVRRYVGALSALQDELGWLNDATVADGLLQELQQMQIALAADAGFARGYLRSDAQREDRQLLKLWKRFTPIRLPCR